MKVTEKLNAALDAPVELRKAVTIAVVLSSVAIIIACAMVMVKGAGNGN